MSSQQKCERKATNNNEWIDADYDFYKKELLPQKPLQVEKYENKNIKNFPAIFMYLRFFAMIFIAIE